MPRGDSQVDFSNSRQSPDDESFAPQFAGEEIPLAPRLTIFGSDLPDFCAWACQNGVREVRHVTDSTAFAAQDHEFVAHDFGRQIALERIGDIGACLAPLLAKSARLLLFIDITDRCTIETVRRALHVHMPELAFRIVYPRQSYKATGMRVIVVEKRRPRAYLFLSSAMMAGKTETSLALTHGAGIRVLHGDEQWMGIVNGKIAAPADLRRGLRELPAWPRLDRPLFAAFIATMPEFEDGQDIAFDFGTPSHLHAGIVDFFHERGFFPVLCLTRTDLTSFADDLARVNEVKRESEQHRSAAERYRAQIEFYEASTSWRLTAPLRFLARRLPILTRLRRAWHRTGANR